MKKLFVAGFGPGQQENMTFACHAAITAADILVGYSKYIELIQPLYPQKPVYSSGMRQ